MKKIYLALLCVASLTLGVACSGGQKTDATETETDNQEEVMDDEVIADADDSDITGAAPKAELTLTVEEEIPADLKAIYAKGDFQPCMAVFFKDDLKDESVGEFPSKWDISNGSAEVAKFEGRTVIKLDNNDAEIVPLVVGESKNYLPEVFTLEFDYYCNGDAEEDFNANYHLWFRDATNSDLGEVSISTEDRLNWSMMKTNDEWVDGTSDKLTEFEKKNAWNHFSLSFDKGTLKVFVNGQRLFSLPKIKAPASFAIRGEGWEDHRYCFTNVRLATNVPEEE